MTAPDTKAAGPVLIFVHGRECKPALADYFALAQEALVAGVARDYPDRVETFQTLDMRVAWYGDLNNAFLAGCAERYDEQLDLGDRRNLLQQLRSIDRRKKFSLAAYDRLPGKSALPELAAGIAAPVLGSLGTRTLVSNIASDVREYWNAGSTFGASVRERVRDTLCDALGNNHPVLLMSHGTGAIVTYDVLWQLSHDERFAEYHDRKVDSWITLGAPLGDNSVRRRLYGAKESGRRRYPGNIVSWHNVSAEDDWLCHDNTLADDFKTMLKQRLLSTLRDYHIYNLAVRYGRSDPHNALGYLIHPRVTQLVSDWACRYQPDADPDDS
ncbi:MAG: hypothetical protein WD078_05705 [Woeseia sp.]